MHDPTRPSLEWLETDGLGGFAMGTADGVRTRRYHGLLAAPRASEQPADRLMLLNGFEAWVQVAGKRFDLISQRYAPGVLHPRPERDIESFTIDPWPKWTYRLGDGTRIEHELFMRHGASLIACSWRLCKPLEGIRLFVRPFLSGRDYHALHHENAEFAFNSVDRGGRIAWRPYRGLPGLVVRSNASYRHDSHWYRHFEYDIERDRGFDSTEDLGSPGVFEFNLSEGQATWIIACEGRDTDAIDDRKGAIAGFQALRAAESRRRGGFRSRLHLAADQYVVSRGDGKSIIAGYPWFADWGRDTFIAMRGLCLATGRLEDARRILLNWSSGISRGMLPNRFPDSSSSQSVSEPEYNSVDASLWFVIAAHEFLEAADRARFDLSGADRHALQQAVLAIVQGYAAGTRYDIRLDESDGLLAAGGQGQQLTWMDARVNGHEVTPRIGKPVEVQALWLNALWIASRFSDRWLDVCLHGSRSFRKLFWNDPGRCLFDVIDDGHVRGKVDPAFRPNQIFAIGGLPLQLLQRDQARMVVEAVEKRLLTPLGLRTLPRDDARYSGRYEGGPGQRDASYHQGTVWPWLMGAFVEAWVRVRGGSPWARRQARQRFIKPLLSHLLDAGLGHLSEIADGDLPHTPRGCPFQAWSLGELLRTELILKYGPVRITGPEDARSVEPSEAST